MSFTSSLNYIEKLTQDASGSLNLYGSGSTGRTELLSIDGNNGRLFTVSDDLSDSLFSVNTIAGLPVIEAFADNSVNIGQYSAPPIKVIGASAIITGSLFGTATTATNVNVTANNSTNETTYLTFVDGATGTQGIETDTALSYNPSTNVLTAGTFSGAFSGTATNATNATNATVTTSATDSAFKIPFANTTGASTGNYGLLQDSESGIFTYNPSSNRLIVPNISGSSINLTGGHVLFNYLGSAIFTAASGTTIQLGGGPGGVQNNVNVANGTLTVGTSSPQGKFHVFQGTTLGGTAGNNVILQTLQNYGGSGGNSVYIKDYAVRDATGTTWTSWRHHNSIDVDGAYNTPGTNTRCFWERDPYAGIHYFGDSGTTALTVNGAENKVIAPNIEVSENTAGIYSDGGDLAIGDWNGNDYGTSFYGQGGNNLINLATNFTQFYYPIHYNGPQGTSEVNGEVAYWGGGSVAAGNLYYYNSSGNWAQVDADAASTATGMLGIARATGTASTVGMLLRGRARYTSNSNYTALSTTGAPLYISTTPGGFTQTAPTGTGDIVRIIGYVLSTASDEIYFCPDSVWVEVI
ncbi:tail fiber protein [Flavobacterium phage vB_FspM_immuto_3-5A]|uniref:Tail fiber protein n=1 Tax=Flavobacterium phage vB_FspM_immuto_2-6A TaxID=2801477 RepID=A0A7T8ERK6_9CAUD|nr:tail fiber protein [Flavobacterium phage vB_FspM_immuto_2-6A]QQO91903.1 tail fiber protein [Flavobacterium phage vB_FspM_immuto_2-6A]QQO92141.1 tail fiber protein [Flavobacterium phage vB_FspM_immuto_3-5A]QQO92379.1 tail fiber protein [Flavobacterium phage vB_FspM_immuto_13-6C]